MNETTITPEISKWLTENVVGICWHELDSHKRICVKCRKTLYTGTFEDKSRTNPDYSTWDGLGLLKNAIKKWSEDKKDAFHYWLGEYIYEGESRIIQLILDANEPVPFALAIHLFGEERPEEFKEKNHD